MSTVANATNSRELLRKLHQDRSELLLSQPFTAGLALRLEIVVVNGDDERAYPRVRTAATDGRTLYFDAEFTAGLDDRTRRFVLCHEVWHCVMGHLRRQLGREHQRWNRAIDYEVNAICCALLGFVPEMALYNFLWKDLSAEHIYTLLENGQELPEMQATEVLDQHLPMNSFSAQQWREYVQQALSRNVHAGRLPGHLRQRLEEAVSDRLPWQHILQRFVQRQMTGERQWYPPSRRHIHRGLYLPRQSSELLELTIAIDTSASCMRDFGEFLTQLNYLLGSYRQYEVTVLQCDTRITSVERYTADRPLRVADFKFEGMGGTRFQPVFDYVRDNPTPALVYFTDGYADEPINEAGVAVLWVLTSDGVEKMEGGESVRIVG
ncbi:DUF2201 family putative metallopeptidase [Pseudidiomarina sp.]|uniref:vWA domain-containing protein n=1 Tax=Pseudidiomarina sp. TaxID=2081707 RepID=UPI003A97752A